MVVVVTGTVVGTVVVLDALDLEELDVLVALVEPVEEALDPLDPLDPLDGVLDADSRDDEALEDPLVVVAWTPDEVVVVAGATRISTAGLALTPRYATRPPDATLEPTSRPRVRRRTRAKRRSRCWGVLGEGVIIQGWGDRGTSPRPVWPWFLKQSLTADGFGVRKFGSLRARGWALLRAARG